MKRIALFAVAVMLVAGAAFAQIPRLPGADKLKGAQKALDDLTFTEEEERTLGQDISAKLRDKYGVVQDRNVHKYVTLVGQVLASASSRPRLPWTFIVLDTDGVNAFAAPGGFVHITKGALALIQNEAELADVLGHEIVHVTAKHTLNAIRKSKGLGLGASASRSQVVQAAANRGYEMVIENAFDRSEEEQSDKEGVALANKAGYAPAGLGAFLARLADRNKNLKERSGVFSSHRDTQTRLDALKRAISSQKLAATALVAARYDQAINFTLLPIDKIPQAAPPAPGQQAQSQQKTGGSGAFGLGGLSALKGGKSNDTVSSAASRGVNPDRDARGGPNKGVVVVAVTAAEIAEFRKGIV
jgi:predicted Zn-dependent protease